MGDGERLTRMSGSTRTLLQVASVLLIGVGAILFLSVFFTMFSSSPDPGSPGSMDDTQSQMASTAARGVIGIVLLGIGSTMAKFAFLKPVSELVATETEGAVSHVGRSAARGIGAGLAESGVALGAPREVVKVKCRGCGYLESEDAKFCSSCGQAV